MSFFKTVPEIPIDPIFGLTEEFKKDSRKKKWNLSIGVYRDEPLKPFVMQVVKEAQKRYAEKETSKEYLPIDGSPLFLEKIGKLVFGEHYGRKSIAAAQTAGGTGALRLGADLLKTYVSDRLLVSDPTWPNHLGIFSRVGFSVEKYPYYDQKTAGIVWDEMQRALKKAPEKAVIVLQPCGHNPSGMNLSASQWKEVAGIMKERRLIPFFDLAYQGFAQGIEKDTQALLAFMEMGLEFLLAYSCSKNFSLYSERTGALFVLCQEEAQRKNVQSALKVLIRNNISNPPAHGARIVEEILSDAALEKKWREEVEQIRKRIVGLRQKVAQNLKMPHIAKAEGMFGYLHLSPSDVERIKKEKGIYMTSDSRINLAALDEESLALLSHAIF